MKKKNKISYSERLEIKILIDKGKSHRDIAKALDRSNSSISYEIRVNSVKGEYNPQKAQTKLSWRRTHTKKDWKKIDQDRNLKQYIIDKLKSDLNPDEISNVMRNKKPFYASKTAIYEWLRSARGQYYCKYLYSKRYYKKKKVKKTERVMIPDRVSIDDRFKSADNRSRYGHWESDAVVSGKLGSGSLSVSVERKSRLVSITKLNDMSAYSHSIAHKNVVSNYKTLSMTFDNGIENKRHKDLNIPTYFCDPYSSWQKGSVENVNKMIRRYIPKGTNISKLSSEYIKFVEDRLNNKPRKILKYKTPLEVALKAGIIKSECAD